MSVKEKTTVDTKVKLKPPKRYGVKIYNDDLTPVDFVIVMFMKVFGFGKEEAEKLTYEINESEFKIVGNYSKEHARELVNKATEVARLFKFPLFLEAVELPEQS